LSDDDEAATAAPASPLLILLLLLLLLSVGDRSPEPELRNRLKRSGDEVDGAPGERIDSGVGDDDDDEEDDGEVRLIEMTRFEEVREGRRSDMDGERLFNADEEGDEEEGEDEDEDTDDDRDSFLVMEIVRAAGDDDDDDDDGDGVGEGDNGLIPVGLIKNGVGRLPLSVRAVAMVGDESPDEEGAGADAGEPVDGLRVTTDADDVEATRGLAEGRRTRES
jgi:hypothetical protein